MQQITCFNSTLVRLEVAEGKIPENKLEFQFHFGSIGSVGLNKLAECKDVSIPLWFDWKPISIMKKLG